MPEIREIWDQVTAYLTEGISVIPIRDKDEEFKGEIKTKKSPYGKWEKYQNEIIKKEELWFLLERYNTSAIATVCGRVSGNMEAVDIDVKWMPGIDKLLFDAIKASAPELLPKLRIVKTPSGGWHLIYRVEIGCLIPGSLKLSRRHSTDEELAASPKEKTKCFIETRGEGGYVAAPPSLGYVVVQNVELAVLTTRERELLHNICLSFNQVVKEEAVKASSQDSFYYDVNPFEAYNKSTPAERVLTDNGFTFHSEHPKFIYFSRPGSKSKGLHCAFMKESRLYRFFSTNTEFDVNRSYKPATVRGMLEFNGNMKLLHVKLVQEGYGVIKREHEKSLVSSAAITGAALPPNVSAAAQEQYKIARESVTKAMPYGIFWEEGEKGAIEIIRELFLTVCEKLGFRSYKGMLCQIDGKFIYWREQKFFFNALKTYIEIEDGDMYIAVCSSFELFLQKSGEFMVTRLIDIEKSQMLCDTREISYKFYLNGYLKITAEGKELLSYENVRLYILESDIQKRNFIDGDRNKGMYAEFLKLACRFNESEKYVMKVIGYLSHQYKDEATPYIIVLTETCADPKDGGGSGKNVFTNLLKSTTTVGGISGTQVKFDNAFLQAWNLKDRIFAVSDVPKKFDFLFLKELSSGVGVVKKLYKDDFTVAVEEMPKLIISTNYSYDVSDGGLKRRIMPVEFSDFFTKSGGVDIHFGGLFPNIWKEEDWAGYDNMIADSIVEWIRGDLKIKPVELTEGGFLKQFDQTYKKVLPFIEENWENWILDGGIVPNPSFKKQYEDYCSENMIPMQFRMDQNKMHAALDEWCKHKKYVYQKDKQKRIGEWNGKCRLFLQEAPF